MDATRFTTPVSRRRLVKLALGSAAAMAIAGNTLTREVSARSGGGYRTTTAVNLRANPSTSAKILAVMPKGSVVAVRGNAQNGFLPITYNGANGWAFASLLEFFTDSAPAPVIIGRATARTAVNLREGASTGFRVIRVIKAGEKVQITPVLQNGFRQVVHLGDEGWVHDTFLTTAAGDKPGIFFTTQKINLRARPDWSAKAVAALPKGAQVFDYDFEMVNGWRGVDYNGKVGWIHDSKLRSN